MIVWAYNLDLNECNNDHNSCKNGATCINFYGGYSCECRAGFTGPRCENGIQEQVNSMLKQFVVKKQTIADINECASDPCFNDATCFNTLGSFICVCTPGYTGKLCDQGISRSD